MHKLLKRQLAKSKSSNAGQAIDIDRLSKLVSETYEDLYSDQKRADAAAGEQNTWFEAAIDNMPHGLALFNDKRELAVFNDKFATIYGLKPEQLHEGMAIEDLVQLRVDNGFYFGEHPKELIDDSLKMPKDKQWSSRVYQLNTGQEIEIIIEPLKTGGYLSTHTDITERQSAERKIYHLANKDPLTSLPNRRSFFNQLEKLTKTDKGSIGKNFIAGLIDLDGFKRINDVFGHLAGDDLLIKASERLTDVLGENITLARLGGDQFGLIITEPEDIDNIVRIGQKTCEAMRHIFYLPDGNVQIASTIGFVEYPKMADTAQLIFERADYALCYSKQHSKGEAVIFSEKHETIIREVANIEYQLNNADLDKELSMLYQPIVDLQTHKTVGFEALARWNNPILGNVRPDIFINSAEQIGTIGKITTILLTKALSAACEWTDNVYLSFNLSAHDLSSEQTVLNIISIVEKSNFPNNRIVFEVTETAVMQDFEQANLALELLKLQGARIALDDFGTGYSSLSYVQRMPLDRLKIDRSFINEVHTDKNTLNIVRTITDLCKNLNLYCIIEGVENEAQLAVLEDIGCRYIQGYYFSRPLGQQEALEFLGGNDIIWSAAPKYGS